MSKLIYVCGFSLLVSCAPFKPVLAPESSYKTLHQNPIKLKVTGLDGYQNYAFYNYLQKKVQMLRTQKPMTFIINLSQADYNLSYAADATTTRTEHDLIASYELWDQDKETLSQKPRATGTLRSTVSYSLDENDEFSTLNSRFGADEKNLQSLAEEMFREILAVIGDNSSQNIFLY